MGRMSIEGDLISKLRLQFLPEAIAQSTHPVHWREIMRKLAGLAQAGREQGTLRARSAAPLVPGTVNQRLRSIAERNVAEVERIVRSYFQDRDNLEPVSRQELLERVRAGTVTVLDVRPEDEFALGHLPGAVNVPLRALEARFSELDPSREIVASCRGAYCVLSYEAVAVLRARGFKARRLEEGFPEWRSAALPVVVGAA